MGGVHEDTIALRAHEKGDVFMGLLRPGAIWVLDPAVNLLPQLVQTVELLAETEEGLSRRQVEGLIATAELSILRREAHRQTAVVGVGVQVVDVLLQHDLAGQVVNGVLPWVLLDSDA